MEPTRWEYMTVEIGVAGFWGPKVRHAELVENFNRHGAEGWELVSTLDITVDEGRSSRVIAFFKRPCLI